MNRNGALKDGPPRSLRMRYLAWRNRMLGSASFRHFAARIPLLRHVARRRAGALFDLVAGFVYSQVLFAVVASGLLGRLSQGPASLADVMEISGFREDAALRLLRAAAAIEIFEEGEPGWWVLGRQGAALQGNEGAVAMIHHHRLLYADLTDPLAILADDSRTDTKLAHFWRYASADDESSQFQEVATEYSQLMSQSQAAVAEEVVAAFPFSRATSLLDVGGGNGTFLRHVAAAHPQLRLGLFDLPNVVALAKNAFPGPEIPQFHAGNFFSDSIPTGYDLVSLVRVLHDHDDEPAQQLLDNIHRSMKPGACLILAEPMAGTSGARGMGDAYFGMYLWAMGSGRPRSVLENCAMLERAGFASPRVVATGQPVVTSLVVASA